MNNFVFLLTLTSFNSVPQGRASFAASVIIKKLYTNRKGDIES